MGYTLQPCTCEALGKSERAREIERRNQRDKLKQKGWENETETDGERLINSDKETKRGRKRDGKVMGRKK